MNNDKEPVPNDSVWACITCGAPYGPHDCAQAKEPITAERIAETVKSLRGCYGFLTSLAATAIESLQSKLAEAEDALRSTDITVENARTALAEAEAKIERVSAERHDAGTYFKLALKSERDKLAEAEAKIARVDSLCKTTTDVFDDDFNDDEELGVYIKSIRAALADTEETK
jgi:septal ring factor EnvC (AmiA/AmiB activator)